MILGWTMWLGACLLASIVSASAQPASEPQPGREVLIVDVARVGRNSDRRFRHLYALGDGGSPCGHPPYNDPMRSSPRSPRRAELR
jgi:hypothetical protein